MADERALTAASERLLARLYPKVTNGRGRMLGFQWAEYDALRVDLRAIEDEAALRAGAAHDEGLREAVDDVLTQYEQTHDVGSGAMGRLRAAFGPTGDRICLHGVDASEECPECGFGFLASSPEPVPSEPDAG